MKFPYCVNPSIHELTLYSKTEVIWVIRNEMAMTVEDVFARRLRLLFIDTCAAIEVAPQVAWLMAQKPGRDENWVVEQIRDFTKIAKGYLINQSDDPKD